MKNILGLLHFKRAYYHSITLLFVYILIFIAFSIFPSSVNAQVPSNTILSCSNTLGSNTLDAECRCGPKQCRLSSVGDLKMSIKNSGGESESVFNTAKYMCVDANQTLNGIGKQSEFRAEAVISAVNEGKGKGCFTPEQIERTKITYMAEYINDENGIPCYQLAIQSSHDLNGNPYSTQSYLKGGDPYVCSKNTFFIGFVPAPKDTTCNGLTFWFTPDPTNYKRGTTQNDKSQISVREDCYEKSKTTDGYSILTCGGSKTDTPNDVNKSPFYTKYFVDDFNKNPAAQNIPDGAKCTVGLNGKGDRAYWYYSNYFTNVTGSTNSKASCTPLLTKKDIFNREVDGVDTFFGCLPASLNGLVSFVIRLIIGFAGLITFIVVLINLYKIIGNSTNPDVVTDSRKKLTAAVITFIVILASITILNIIGLRLLDIDSFGGGLLRLFTGG